MSASPLVSAILPVHDGEAYVAEAIESVLAQDYRPVEIVVVDDGSADDSARIASRYTSVRLLRQQNRGVCAARNAGGGRARGAACLSRSGRLLATAQAQPPGAIAARGGVERVRRRPRASRPRAGRRAADVVAVSGTGDERPGYFPGTLVVRRNVFERVGPFREDAAPGRNGGPALRAAELGVEHAVVPAIVLLKPSTGITSRKT